LFSWAGLPIVGALIHHFDRQNVTLLAPSEERFSAACRAGDRFRLHLVSPVTNGTMSSSTRYELTNVPCVIRRPCHLDPGR
jgi:hypothetical protein